MKKLLGLIRSSCVLNKLQFQVPIQCEKRKDPLRRFHDRKRLTLKPDQAELESMTSMELSLLALVFSPAKWDQMVLPDVINYVRLFICSKYLPPLPMGVSSLLIDLRLGCGAALASGIQTGVVYTTSKHKL